LPRIHLIFLGRLIIIFLFVFIKIELEKYSGNIYGYPI
jgi:hypothetical protein